MNEEWVILKKDNVIFRKPGHFSQDSDFQLISWIILVKNVQVFEEENSLSCRSDNMVLRKSGKHLTHNFLVDNSLCKVWWKSSFEKLAEFKNFTLYTFLKHILTDFFNCFFWNLKYPLCMGPPDHSARFVLIETSDRGSKQMFVKHPVLCYIRNFTEAFTNRLWFLFLWIDKFWEIIFNFGHKDSIDKI